MKLSVTQAKAQLTEIVRLAEAGEEVVLTRFGRDVVRLVPLRHVPLPAERRVALERARAVRPQARQARSNRRPQPGFPV